MMTLSTARLTLAAMCIVAVPSLARAQAAGPSPAAQSPAPVPPSHPLPPTGRERIDWVVQDTIGARSLFVIGPLATIWQTGFDQPPEWQRSWSGAGKRYANRLADVAISDGIEASLGSLWDENPFYRRMGHGRFGARARHVIGAAFVSVDRNGRARPAWARYAGNTLNNVIENTWLPPSATTASQTLVRCGLGFLTLMGGNAWKEFWPDVQKRLRRP